MGSKIKLILGSGSKHRQQLLTSYGFEYDIIKPNVDEKTIRDSNPKKLVLKLAHAKNKAVCRQLSSPAIVLTADQVVSFNNQIREKPKDIDEAREFLKSYSNNFVEVINGLVAKNIQTDKTVETIQISKASFAEIPKSVIDWFVEDSKILFHAGALAIENPKLTPFIKSFDGTHDAVMGLPKKETLELIDAVKD